MNDAQSLKIILDSLVLKSDRDFTVELSTKPSKQFWARYYCDRKLILVFPRDDKFKMLASAIHELGHHLCRKYGGRHGHGHGKLYIATLDRLVKIFNLQYRKRAKSELHFNKRRPAINGLKWVALEKTERGGNIGVKEKSL